ESRCAVAQSHIAAVGESATDTEPPLTAGAPRASAGVASVPTFPAVGVAASPAERGAARSAHAALPSDGQIGREPRRGNRAARVASRGAVSAPPPACTPPPPARAPAPPRRFPPWAPRGAGCPVPGPAIPTGSAVAAYGLIRQHRALRNVHDPNLVRNPSPKG